MPTEDTNPTVRFAGYSFDLKSGELSGHGTKVRLPHQPARILALLIQHAGEVVSREEIARHVWGSETFVDFGKGLNFAVWQIRRHLAEDAERPRFIETVPKRGYRFISLLEQPEAVLEGHLEPGPEPPPVDAAAGPFPLSSPTAAAPAAAPSPQPPATHGPANYAVWSADSEYLYFNAISTEELALFRVHVPDGKKEQITRVPFRSTGARGTWSGLAPDGSPLLLRSRSQADVYALRLANP